MRYENFKDPIERMFLERMLSEDMAAEQAQRAAEVLNHGFWEPKKDYQDTFKKNQSEQLKAFWPLDSNNPENYLRSVMFSDAFLDKTPWSLKTALIGLIGSFLFVGLWFNGLLMIGLDAKVSMPQIELVLVMGSVISLLAMFAAVAYTAYRLSPPPLRYGAQTVMKKIEKMKSKKTLYMLAAMVAAPLFFNLYQTLKNKSFLGSLGMLQHSCSVAAPILGYVFLGLIVASLLLNFFSRFVSPGFLIKHPWLVMDAKKFAQFQLLAPDHGHTSFVMCLRDADNPRGKIRAWFDHYEQMTNHASWIKEAKKNELMHAQWDAVRGGLSVLNFSSLNCFGDEQKLHDLWTELTQGGVSEDAISLKLHKFNQYVIGLDADVKKKKLPCPAAPNDGITWVERLGYLQKTMLCKRYAPALALQKVVSDHGIGPREKLQLSQMIEGLAEVETKTIQNALENVQATWTALEKAVNAAVSAQNDALIQEADIKAFSKAVEALEDPATNNRLQSEPLRNDLKSVKNQWAYRLESIQKLQEEVKAWQASAPQGAAADGTHALLPPLGGGGGAALRRPHSFSFRERTESFDSNGSCYGSSPDDSDEEDEDESKGEDYLQEAKEGDPVFRLGPGLRSS